jgi:hypothetical protein
MSILWEMDRKGTIRKTKGPACGAPGGAEAGPAGAEPVENRVDRLSLAARAMWELVKERTGLTEDDLLRKVEEIDLSDGRLDGKVRKAVECAACGKRIADSHSRCLYCGAAQARGTAFP